MISLPISELVRMASLWPLNKANQPPATWSFYQCICIIWTKKICLLQFYMRKVHGFLERQILDPLVTMTSPTMSRPPSSNHSDEDQITWFSKDWGTNFIEVRNPLKPMGPARHETQHINTPWQDKGRHADYLHSSANDRVVNGLYTRHFSQVLISRWLLASRGMKNKFPLRARTTGSLELKGELTHSWKLRNKPQTFVISTPQV